MVKPSFIAGTGAVATVVAVGSLAGVLGCTSSRPPDEPAAAHRPALINGATANAEFEGVLRIVADVECTGFLLTNQWAITARHCISSVLASQPEQITVNFGGTRSAPAQTATVAEVQRSPPGPDLALLRLSTPLNVQGTSYGYLQRGYPSYATFAQGMPLACTGWGSTGAANPPSDRPSVAALLLDTVNPPLLGLGTSMLGQQVAAGDAGGFCSVILGNFVLPAGLIAGLYTDGEGVAIDLTQQGIRSWVESTLVARDPDIPANAASIPAAASLDGREADLVWIDGAGQMNGSHLGGFPLSPDAAPTLIGASSTDLFANARPAAAYSNGTLHMLGTTVSGNVVEGVSSALGPVTTWTPVAVMPPVNGGLGVANRDPDRFDLLARSATGPVAHAWFSGGTWVSSELIGGSFDEDVLATWDSGTLQPYGVALKDVFHKWGSEGQWAPGQDEWASQNINGNVTSACAAVALADSTMDLVARIPNGHLGHKTWVNGWVDEFPDLGLPVPDEPSIVIAAGAIHVFARNPDGTIWHAHFPR